MIRLLVTDQACSTSAVYITFSTRIKYVYTFLRRVSRNSGGIIIGVYVCWWCVTIKTSNVRAFASVVKITPDENEAASVKIVHYIITYIRSHDFVWQKFISVDIFPLDIWHNISHIIQNIRSNIDELPNHTFIYYYDLYMT